MTKSGIETITGTRNNYIIVQLQYVSLQFVFTQPATIALHSNHTAS